MGMFGPSQWEIKALVIISAQLHSIQRKLDMLLAATANIPPGQLAELQEESNALKAKAQALSALIEQQQPIKGK